MHHTPVYCSKERRKIIECRKGRNSIALVYWGKQRKITRCRKCRSSDSNEQIRTPMRLMRTREFPFACALPCIVLLHSTLSSLTLPRIHIYVHTHIHALSLFITLFFRSGGERFTFSLGNGVYASQFSLSRRDVPAL